MIFSIEAVKASFFDRQKVVNKVRAAKLRVLNRTGGYLRKVAKNSIKESRAVSFPHGAPSSHTDETKGNLKNFIFYSYDAEAESALVGPVKLNRTDGEAPGLLERGGTVTRVLRGLAKIFRYRPRPYMRPALIKTIPRMPEAWRDVLLG